MAELDVKTGIATGTFFGISYKTANILVKALLAPLVIAKLGLAGFGVWNLLVAVANYPRLGVGGVDAAFQKYVSDATATEDYDAASELLTTGTLMVMVGTSLVSVPFLVFTGSILTFAGVPLEYRGPFAVALRYLVLVVLFANSTAAYGSILGGAHRLDLKRIVNTVSLVFEAVLTVVLLLMGYRLFALAAPYGVGQVARTFVYMYLARRVLPRVTIAPRCFSMRRAGELARFAGSFHLVGLLEMLYLSTVPVLVMKYCGANISGLYAAAKRLVLFCSLAGESLMLPLLAGSAYAFGRGDTRMGGRVFRNSLRFMLITGLPVGVFMTVFADQILYAWTGESADIFKGSMVIMVAIVLSGMMARHHMIVYRASGGAVHDLVWMALRMGGFLGVGVVLVRAIGYFGLLLGQLCGELIALGYMMGVMQVRLKFRYHALKGDVTRWYWVGIAFVGFAYVEWLASEVAVTRFPGRMSAVVVLGMAFAGYVLVVCGCVWWGLDVRERARLRSWIPFEGLNRSS